MEILGEPCVTHLSLTAESQDSPKTSEWLLVEMAQLWPPNINQHVTGGTLKVTASLKVLSDPSWQLILLLGQATHSPTNVQWCWAP